MEPCMEERVMRIFRRNRFEMSDIKYITHTNQRTYIALLDGRNIMTTVPLKTFFAQLDPDDFWNIQKGVVVSARHTADIDDSGVYTMVDGRQFQGRSRNPAEHKRRRRLLRGGSGSEKSTLTLLEQCTLMEDAPVAFSVIEMRFSEDGRGIDFIFRFCNPGMEELTGVPIGKMVDRSFYEVFPGGDKKWIVPYADVAINGTKRIIRDAYSPEVDKNLTIRCFQPKPGFVACILVES